MRTTSLCHRLSNLGVTAVTRAYVVPTAACTVTVCPAGGSAALTIFQSRDIAFMHGRHNLYLRSRLPELHDSHFIRDFRQYTLWRLGSRTPSSNASEEIPHHIAHMPPEPEHCSPA